MNKNHYPNLFSRAVFTLFVVLLAFSAKAETLTVGYGAEKSNKVPVYGYNVDCYQKCEFIIPATDLNSMCFSSIQKMEFFLSEKAGRSWSYARFKVYMREVSEMSFPSSEATFMGFEESDLVYEGSLDATGDIMEITFDNAFFYGIDNLLVGIYQVETGYYSSCLFLGNTVSNAALVGSDGDSLDDVVAEPQNFLPLTRFTYVHGELPSITKPTDLMVADITTNSAVVSWNSDATVCELCINDDENSLLSVSDNSYELTNLKAGTSYEVKVRAVSGDMKSQWTETVSFTTLLCDPENTVTISYRLTDSYGDGWNGNAINVKDAITGEILVKWTIEEGSEASGTLSLCLGHTVIFEWEQGGYSSECSYEVFDGDGVLIFSGEDAMTEPVEYTATNVKTPNNLQVEYELDMGENISTVITWDQPDGADRWQYRLDGGMTQSTDRPFARYRGLVQGLDYTFEVRAFRNGEEGFSAWSKAVTLNTERAVPAPTNLTASNVGPTQADISWEGEADSYHLRYKKIDKSNLALVTLTANNVWDDGTGYQMLLDANATAYGTIIPTTGALTTGGDATEETYAEFEYKIPSEADGSLTTSNIVFDGSVTIQIPAGTYDWCITNPTPGDRMWIASENGNVGGRQDNYVFEAGKAYEFKVSRGDQHDQVDVTITGEGTATDGPAEDEPAEEWTLQTDVNSPITLDGLDPETIYVVEVQGIYGTTYKHEGKWATSAFLTTAANPEPYDVAVEPSATTANISWTGWGDSYKVSYRRAGYYPIQFFEDFENGIPDDWTLIDADGDGQGWYAFTAEGSGYTMGSTCATSASYNDTALTPDNWLITPQITLTGKLSVWLRAQDPRYAAEHFAIYVSNTGNAVEDFIEQIVPETEATGEYVEYTYDLSQSPYNMTKGYIGIRHFNCTDMFRLNLDNFGIYDDFVEAGETLTETTTSNSLLLTGLSPETTYEFAVVSLKEGCEPASTLMATFTTTAQGTPTAVAATPIAMPANGDWYTLDGRKLSGKPTKKGIYLKGNKKVVVK